MKFQRKHLFAMTAVAVATAAVAATVITVKTPFALSDGTMGDKPKLQRLGDGTLVTAYGDSPAGAGMVYDVKAAEERTARDIFVKTCKPDATKTCDNLADWSAAINVSNSALQLSAGTFDWGGDDTTSASGGVPSKYPGDIDKPNIKTSGPMMVLTWVSKYCPDGDLSTPEIDSSKQRAIKYLERDSRVIPFSCTWMSYSTTKGASWSPAKQLNTGERDAIQDASSGSIVTDTTSTSFNKGQINISWQEDPQGLQLGEADGPGDGASGANVNGGTDVWYAYATVDLTQPKPAAGSEYNTDYLNLRPAARLTDNATGTGINGSVNYIYDGAGANVPDDQIEKGQAGAARPNIGMVGGTSIVAYEETKGSQDLDEGKFVRYHAFPFATPPATAEGKAGCVISDPAKNARRVRFLTQSPADAGPGGIQIGIFWKEGAYDNGGPSDIMVRRGMGGLQPDNMVPAVDPACATSDYTIAINLQSANGDNISSMTPTATAANLADDTEGANYTENALAHRGVLRGTDMWIGYSYTSDLVKLWAQLDNYNFWIRKFTVAGGWEAPKNVTNIENKGINVREPRIFGTPKSNATTCPTGNPTDPTTTNASDCQNANVVYLAWGTQTNVSPYDPAGAQDLGEYVTVSQDSGNSFATPVKMSVAQGVLWGDDETAYEAQPVTRPDGTRFYSVWNQKNLTTGATVAEYVSGDVAQVTDPVTPPTTGGDGGGCSVATGERPVDPVLPLLASLGLIGWALRRRSARQR